MGCLSNNMNHIAPLSPCVNGEWMWGWGDISTFSSALWSLGIETSGWESGKRYTQVHQSAGFCKGHDLAVSCLVSPSEKQSFLRIGWIQLMYKFLCEQSCEHILQLHLHKKSSFFVIFSQFCFRPYWGLQLESLTLKNTSTNHCLLIKQRDGHSEGGGFSTMVFFPSFKCPADLTRGEYRNSPSV